MITLQTVLGEVTVEDALPGIFYPGPPGDTADQLGRLSSLALRPRALELLARARTAAPQLAALGHVERALSTLTPRAWLSALHHPVAFSHLEAAAQAPAEAQVSYALGLLRFLVGAPELAELDTVLPEQAMPPEGLFLPHLGAQLRPGDGPVAVSVDPAQVRFTWTDGQRLTLPREGWSELAGASLPRLQVLPRAAGMPILNGLGDVSALASELWTGVRGPQVRADLLRAGWSPSVAELSLIDQGVELLRAVWPEAASALPRHVLGFVVLPHKGDGHYHSYTTMKLHHAVLGSLLNPVQVADILVHEASHVRMRSLHGFDPLLEGPDPDAHPSPWRADPRPLSGLLNGLHAFLNVLRFFQRLPDLAEWPRARSEAIVEEQREKLLVAWRYFEPRARPTAAGRALMSTLADELRGL